MFKFRYLLLAVLLLFVISTVGALIYISSGCWQYERGVFRGANSVVEPKTKVRDESRTILALPEWYIVYSAEEYARFVVDKDPSQFPYWSSIGQYWGYYQAVYCLTKDTYELNNGFHVILSVIGHSFSFEYAVKGLYEDSIGQIFEWTAPPGVTVEEQYAQRVAAEYGEFMHMKPWFDFDFFGKLRGLWLETNWWGEYQARKLERRMILSLEYGGKGVYGWIIRRSTRATFGFDEPWREAVVEIPPKAKEMFGAEDLQIKEHLPSGKFLVAIPYYERFTDLVPLFVAEGITFEEIAGNDEIVLSVWAQKGWKPRVEEAKVLFARDVLTEENIDRVVMYTPVGSLDEVLMQLEKDGVQLEHIYDY